MPRRASTAREGNGSRLTSYRLTEAFSRTLFFADITEPSGVHEYAVDVRYSADDEDDRLFGRGADALPPVALYRDGVQILQSDLPAALPVPGGIIEVASSMYGLRRMHVVPDDGPALVLRPDPRTPEGLRAAFARGFPRASAALGRIAVVVLIVGIVVAVPQTIEAISRLDLVADLFGVFTSPVRLPDWLNGALGVATVVAGLERALTLRSHRLLDAMTDLDGSD